MRNSFVGPRAGIRDAVGCIRDAVEGIRDAVEGGAAVRNSFVGLRARIRDAVGKIINSRRCRADVAQNLIFIDVLITSGRERFL